MDLMEMIGSTRSYEFLDQTVLLRTGQLHERRVFVGSSDEPLKITLTYTDVPGFPGAIPALVNDLDLEVVGRTDRVYRGNQFDDGESVPDAIASRQHQQRRRRPSCSSRCRANTSSACARATSRRRAQRHRRHRPGFRARDLSEYFAAGNRRDLF